MTRAPAILDTPASAVRLALADLAATPEARRDRYRRKWLAARARRDAEAQALHEAEAGRRGFLVRWLLDWEEVAPGT